MSKILEINKKSSKSDVLDAAINLINLNEFTSAEKLLLDLEKKDTIESYYYLGYLYELEPNINPIHDYNKAFFYYTKSTEFVGDAESFICIASLFFSELIEGKFKQDALDVLFYLEKNRIYMNGFLYWVIGQYHVNLYGDIEDPNSWLKIQEYFEKGWNKGHILSLDGIGYCLLRQKKYIRSVYYILKSKLFMLPLLLFDKSNLKIRKI